MIAVRIRNDVYVCIHRIIYLYNIVWQWRVISAHVISIVYTRVMCVYNLLHVLCFIILQYCYYYFDTCCHNIVLHILYTLWNYILECCTDIIIISWWSSLKIRKIRIILMIIIPLQDELLLLLLFLNLNFYKIVIM